MSISLDGFEVLRQIGKHADVFAPVRADINKQASALVVKCLKAKSTDLKVIREVRKALGESQFGLVLEGLKDTEAKSILTRVDKHHPEIKKGTTTWRRQHLAALADSSATPQQPPAKAKKAKGKKVAEPARLQSETVDAYREIAKKGR